MMHVGDILSRVGGGYHAYISEQHGACGRIK